MFVHVVGNPSYVFRCSRSQVPSNAIEVGYLWYIVKVHVINSAGLYLLFSQSHLCHTAQAKLYEVYKAETGLRSGDRFRQHWTTYSKRHWHRSPRISVIRTIMENETFLLLHSALVLSMNDLENKFLYRPAVSTHLELRTHSAFFKKLYCISTYLLSIYFLCFCSW